MERRQLTFADSKSDKFWTIELNDYQHSVTYGRTGTAGQTKTKTFSSAAEAKTDFDKMVASKLKKGYVDAVTAAPTATASSSVSAPSTDGSIDVSHFASSDSNYDNVTVFAGKPVSDYDRTKNPMVDGSQAYRFSSDWDDEDRFGASLAHLFAEPRPGLSHLVIGAWSVEMFATEAKEAIEVIVAGAERLPDLRAIFFGEVTMMESEMSWIQQGDVSPLLTAFPNLEVLRVRGGQGLAIERNQHENLRCLALETGGMNGDVVRSVMSGQFPNLEHLELWLGTEQYGGSCSVEDLQPLLSGRLFPKLSYLGLRNCDFVDDIAGVVVNSPIVERIETLDLSMGVLTDDGGEALLSLPTSGSLRKLDLHHHFMTDKMTKRVEALPFTVDISGQEAEDEWRFVAIGE